MAAQFAERHLAALRSAAKTEAMLLPVVKAWAGKIGEITRRDVIELIDGIVDRGAPIMANRTLSLVKTLFAWARERDIVVHSPCDGVRRPAPETPRDRVLEDDELAAVWRAANSIGYPFGPIVKLLIHHRPAAGGGGGHVPRRDRRRPVTIPKERVKNGVVHQVPLSAQALAIIRTLPGTNGHLFTTNGRPASGFFRVKARIDELAPLQPPWVIHDIRRTVATGMQRLEVQQVVVEILNHVSGSLSGVAGIYQRHSFSDEKRKALERWAEHVLEIVR